MPGPLTIQQAIEHSGAKKVATGWRADCPYNPDHKNLLKIDRNSLGALLMRCHGGCTFYWVARSLREKRDKTLICA